MKLFAVLGTYLGALIWSLPSVADTPACFPERAAVGTSDLRDERDRLLGAVRAGKVVAVISDHVGPQGRWADVEIRDPVRLRARVARKELRLFLAEDVPVGPPRTWWTAGAAVQIDGGETRSALVTIESAGPPAIRASCGALTAAIAPERFSRESCCGVSPAARPQVGRYVWWKERQPMDVDLGPGRERLKLEYDDGWLLDRRPDEVLLEVLDALPDLRVQRWVPSKGMEAGDSGRASGTISLCSEIDKDLGRPGGTLTNAVQLRPFPDEPPFTTLPAGTRFRVLDAGDGNARIVARWPGWALEEYTLDVRGWVPIRELPALPAHSGRRYAVIGRLALAPGIGKEKLKTLSMFASDGERRHRVPLSRDGRFRLELDDEESAPESGVPDPEELGEGVRFVHLEVRNAAGDLSGMLDRAPALVGGDEEVVVPVDTSVEIRGYVETETGARVPHREIRPLTMINLPRTRTAADGSFRLLVPPGQHSLCADDSGFCQTVDASASVHGVVIKVPTPRR